jgi:hypothetical protein
MLTEVPGTTLNVKSSDFVVPNVARDLGSAASKLVVAQAMT